MNRPRMIIVKTGQAVAEARTDGRDFEHWFMQALGPERFEYRTIAVDRNQPLPPVASGNPASVVLITGSPAMVSDRLEWSEQTAAWLADPGDNLAGQRLLRTFAEIDAT